MNRKHKGQPGIPNAVAAFVQHAMFHLIFVMLVLFLPRVDSKVVEVAIRKCVPGTPCTAQVSSSSYTSDVPHLMVVREDHPCGAPPDSQFKAAENPVGGTAAVGNTSFFDFGIVGPSPGLFRLCLCTMNCKPSQLVNVLAFNEDVGDLVISGPLEAKQMPAFCIAGGPPCTVNITAIGAHPGLTPVHPGAVGAKTTVVVIMLQLQDVISLNSAQHVQDLSTLYIFADPGQFSLVKQCNVDNACRFVIHLSKWKVSRRTSMDMLYI